MGKASICQPSRFSKLTTWFGFQMVLLFSYVKWFFNGKTIQKTKPGYACLLEGQKAFWAFNFLGRGVDNWSRPCASRPERHVDVMLRKRHSFGIKLREPIIQPIQTRKCINFGSYNYLGFSKPPQHVEEKVLKCVEDYGISTGSSRRYGYSDLIRKLEETVAKFVRREDACLMGMGFATNAMVISNLCGPGDLILSDQLSHTSTRVGITHSGASFANFEHNNMEDLENIVREKISQGQPGSTKGHIIPWRRIWVMFEGIYSMEGEFCHLDQLVALKKKYGLYLYLDEAHSMGGTGRTGRGACEVFGVDPEDIDIMMGTFTKAFGSIGGYIASSKRTCDFIRDNAYGFLYGTSLSPACIVQVIEVIKVMDSEEGKRIIARQKAMASRLNKGLKDRGFETILKIDSEQVSPIICIMLYGMGKTISFGRLGLKYGVACAMAGYPVVSFYENRARLCVSAQHTEEDIDNALEIFDFIGDRMLIKYKLPLWKRLLMSLS